MLLTPFGFIRLLVAGLCLVATGILVGVYTGTMRASWFDEIVAPTVLGLAVVGIIIAMLGGRFAAVTLACSGTLVVAIIGCTLLINDQRSTYCLRVSGPEGDYIVRAETRPWESVIRCHFVDADTGRDVAPTRDLPMLSILEDQ